MTYEKHSWKGAIAAAIGFFVAFGIIGYITTNEILWEIALLGAIVIGILYHTIHFKGKPKKKKKKRR